VFGFVLFSKVIPFLCVVHGINVSSLWMTKPPSLLLQYNSPSGVLNGRCRMGLLEFRMTWSMARMVIGGVFKNALCWKLGRIWEQIRFIF
jgi:hypothetical protein